MGGRRVQVHDFRRGWRGRHTRIERGRIPAAGEHGGQPEQSGRAIEPRNAGGATSCIEGITRNKDRLARAFGAAAALRGCCGNAGRRTPPRRDERSGVARAAVKRHCPCGGGTKWQHGLPPPPQRWCTTPSSRARRASVTRPRPWIRISSQRLALAIAASPASHHSYGIRTYGT